MDGGEHVESYRFADVATLWGRERLEHELLVARRLAEGFVREGLRIHSRDPRWLSGSPGQVELRGYPYVGYAPLPAQPPVVIRATALEHLLAVVNSGREPDLPLLHEEFINKAEFLAWLLGQGIAPPRFWFGQAAAGARPG